MNKKLEAFCFALIGGAVATVADIAVSAYAARKYERYLHDDNDDPNPGEDCAGVDNDLDAFEDIFQDEPENQQPQVDLAALQQIRNDAYQNGYSAGYSAGYNNGASTGQQQGYQAGYAAAASAAAEQVQDAYKEGKLDVYDALNPEGAAHGDAHVDTDADDDHPTVVIADTNGEACKSTVKNAQEQGYNVKEFDIRTVADADDKPADAVISESATDPKDHDTVELTEEDPGSKE